MYTLLENLQQVGVSPSLFSTSIFFGFVTMHMFAAVLKCGFFVSCSLHSFQIGFAIGSIVKYEQPDMNVRCNLEDAIIIGDG